MSSDDYLSIVNVSPSALPSASASALASAFLSPARGGFGSEVDTSFRLDPPVQWGPSLVLIRDHTQVCGGQFGVKKNNCFCCVSLPQSKDCPSRHVVTKHPMTEEAAWIHAVRLYFHKGANSGAVYASPFVDVGSWKSDDIGKMLSKVYTSWQAWSDDVVVIQAAKGSEQDADKIRTAVKVSKTLPRLKSGTEEGGVKVLFQWESKEDQGKVEGSEGDLVQALSNEPAMGIWDSFGPETIKRMNLLQSTLIDLGNATNNKLKELQVGFGVRLMGLETQIGSGGSSDKGRQLEGSSIWRSLEDVQMQIDELKAGDYVDSLKEKVLSSDGFTSHTTSIKEAFQAVMRRVLPLEKRMEDLASEDMKPNNTADWLGLGGNSAKGNSFKLEETMRTLAGRVDNLELTVSPTNNKSESEDVLVSFMGVRFSSEEDVKAYVESINGGKFDVTPGLVTDCYSIFHALNREIFDSKSRLNMVDLAKVSSLGAKQADVYHLLAAAEHGLPEFFDSPTTSGKFFIDGKHGKKHRFNNIASYEIWGPVGTIKDAVRKRAEIHLTRFVKTKCLAIQELANPELCTFLTAMLNTSKEFVEAVFSFLTEEYSALAEHFSDATLCWDFACFLY
jgi:hypothetical protein